VEGPKEQPNETDGAGASGTSTSTGEGNTGNTPVPPPPPPENSCDNPPDPIDPSALPLCPADMCGGGARCVSTDLLAASGNLDQADQLADCDADHKCVPDEFVATLGYFTPETCSSLIGAEGRCLSTCIPEVQAQNSEIALPVDICGEFQVCVPCYHPQTGEPTGACEQACDTGPVEEPTLLPACCGDLGKCVPKGAVPPEQLGNLGDFGCGEAAGEAFICAPNVFIDDPNFHPPSCDDMPFLLTLTLPEWALVGACLPDCLPAISDAAVNLQEGSCGAGFKCAPCYEPAIFGDPKPTGACDL
jgi:hypothetical protein